jgi:dissimilatory sulfite reductase related protein
VTQAREPGLLVAGRTVALDDQGFLVDPADWSEEVAEALARDEGLVLEADHWAVLRFMRAYYDEHGIAVDARHAIKFLAGIRGEKSGGRNDLFQLFPYGYVKQACRIAGMRKPRAWSTG